MSPYPLRASPYPKVPIEGSGRNLRSDFPSTLEKHGHKRSGYSTPKPLAKRLCFILHLIVTVRWDVCVKTSFSKFYSLLFER